MATVTTESRAVVSHAEKLEREATRLEAKASELRQRAAWLKCYDGRSPDDWVNLLRLIRLAGASTGA